MRRLLLAAGAIAALSFGVAAAQPAGGPGAFLAQADANHDGDITRAEWDAARSARFASEDTNQDGQLSGDERPHWGPPPGAGQPPPPPGAPPPGNPPPGGPAGGGGHHPMMNPDANNDGVISRAEYDAQGAALFARLDADHNGVISAAELQAMRDHMHPR